MPEWLQWVTSGGAVGALCMAFATYIKTRPAMKKIELEGEAALWARIERLEAEAKAERQSCDERIQRLEDRHTEALETLRRELAGEVQILRHDRNNIKSAMNYLLISIKKIDHPELQDIAAEAEAMLARGDELIAIERGAMKS